MLATDVFGHRIGLVSSPDHEMISESVSQLLSSFHGSANLRRVRDEKLAAGYAENLWGAFVEAGFAAVMVPEENGGSQLGMSGAVVIAERLGHAMVALPFVERSVGAIVAARGAPSLARTIFASVLSEAENFAFAIDETSHHRPDQYGCHTVTRPDGSLQLVGRKTFVPFGNSASRFLVTARHGPARRVAVVMVDRSAPGVLVEANRMIDGTVAADLSLESVDVAASAVLEEKPDLLTDILDAVRIAVSAELLGQAQAVFERTVAYLKVRRQFGKFIGEFQALQHRAAHMASELEITRALVMHAARQFDSGSAQTSLLASAVKAQSGMTAALVMHEGIQMHGGIGMTDELDLGLYLKRARLLDGYFGDVRYQKRRVAEINGY